MMMFVMMLMMLMMMMIMMVKLMMKMTPVMNSFGSVTDFPQRLKDKGLSIAAFLGTHSLR